MLRKDLDPLHGWVRGGWPGRPAGDPVVERLVLPGAGLDARPAAVRHRPRGLQEEETLDRLGAIDTPRQGLTSEDEVVGVRVIPAEAGLEAARASHGPVTRPRVAPGPRQNRHYLGPEGRRGRVLGLHHTDLRRR